MIDNYRFWILGLFFLFVVNINGQNRAKSVSIDQLPSHTVIDNYLEVYTGKANSPTEIDSSKASFFKPYSWDSIPEGKSVVWLKLSIDNPLNYDYQLVLGNNQFQFLEFYEPVENDNYHVELSGTLCDHSQMQIVQGANSWFSFNVPAKSNKHFYIRASNNQKIKYQYSRQPFTLYSYSEFSVYKKKQTFFNYFFWGALVIITFYNFILYFQLRSKIYLFYVVNNIGILLFVLAQSGLISELFFSNSKHYENLLLILGNLAFIFYVLFCKEFLEFKKNR